MEGKIQSPKNNRIKETETLKFEDNLWDKYEGLHERYRRQYNYLSNLKTVFTKYKSACIDFSKTTINIVKSKYQLFEETNSTQNNALQRLIDNISKQSEAFDTFEKSMPNYIFQKLDSILDPVYYEEKEKYNTLKKSLSNYTYSKGLVEKAKKNFYSSALAVENQLRNLIKNKEINSTTGNLEIINKLEQRKNELMIEAKSNEQKYILEIQNANKSRIDFNQKQNSILQFYEKRDETSGEEIRVILMLFVAELKKDLQTIMNDIHELEDNIKKMDIKKDINQFIEINKNENKPDEEIIFCPYEPITNQKEVKETDDFKYYVIKEMKENFIGLFPDFNIEYEEKKNELRKITINFFKTNVKFNEQDKLLELLKEKQFRDFFLINLSNQRTKGRYTRNKEIIDNLKEILNFILDIAEKEKDYQAGKNCIILGQTFYYEDKNDNNKKVYLFEFIEDNLWLKSINFWNGIIDLMTKIEIEKNNNINKDNLEIDEKEKKKMISNVAFSQLLSYANNMLEFKMDKDIIKHVIDKFVIKYGIEKNLVDAIYANIGITGEIDMNAYNPEEDKLEEEYKNEEKKEDEKKENEEKKDIDNKIEGNNNEDKKEEEKINEDKNEDNKVNEDKKEEEKIIEDKKEEEKFFEDKKEEKKVLEEKKEEDNDVKETKEDENKNDEKKEE